MRFLAGASLSVEDCVIGFNQGSPGFGVAFLPSTGKPELLIKNTTVMGNGSGSNGGAIEIAPTAGAGATVTIVDSVINDNSNGIRVNGQTTTGTIDVAISDTSTSGNTFNGLAALGGGGGPVNVMANRLVSANNGAQGLRGSGTGVTVRFGSSTITANQIGVVQAAGSTVLSYGNNQIDGNTTDGIVSTTPTK